MPLRNGNLLCQLLCSCLLADMAPAFPIPDQLIMTGKPDTFEEMPLGIKRNIKHTIEINQRNLHFRWFGDKACHNYIKDHYDEELLAFFDSMKQGAYRGDICRAAVLHNEGGFYVDVDLQLAMPLINTVQEDTTFASAYTRENDDVLNAFIATAPKSEIMAETLQEMKKWFRGQTEPKGLMGTQTLYRGMQTAVKNSCDVTSLLGMRNVFNWTCGDHNIVMYQEQDLNCFPPDDDPNKDAWSRECPPERQSSPLYGLRLGLFPAGQGLFIGRPFIGWSRFSSCHNDWNGCGNGGHISTPNPQIPKRLIMTGKPESVQDLGDDLRRNVEHTISLNSPQLQLHWLGDKSCHSYIKDHFDEELLRLFDNAKHDAHRSDICRAAVLYNEGGFYVDPDVEMAVPVAELVNETTTFASAYSKGEGNIFNSIIVAVPKSPILAETLLEVRRWFHEKAEQKGLMGSQTMYRGLQNVVRKSCQSSLAEKKVLDKWMCGDHSIRMYQVQDLYCFPPDSDPDKEVWGRECPSKRKNDPAYESRLGLFPAGQELFVGRPFIGWSRFTACTSKNGCTGGHDSNVVSSPLLREATPKVTLAVTDSGSTSAVRRSLKHTSLGE